MPRFDVQAVIITKERQFESGPLLETRKAIAYHPQSKEVLEHRYWMLKPAVIARRS